VTASGSAWQPAEQQGPATDTPPHADPVPAAPDDAQQLKEEIERTREQLGETVGQLAAKADMKSRARAKAAELTGRMKTSTARAGQQAAARTASARSQFAGTTATARQAAAKGASTARQRPIPLAVAVALVGCLVIWQWRKR